LEPQQLATKVAQLESRVATLEDEGKIVRGEVKQILTEIRTAILVRENPFEGDGGLAGAPPPHMATTTIQQSGPPVQEIHLHAPEPAQPVKKRAPEPEPEGEDEEEMPLPAPKREPVMLRPQPAPPPAPAPAPEPERPQWSLLTIAGLSAWAEEAMRRLGSLRLEILLDLCETAGHITPEARAAMARVSELDIPEPAQPPSTNETVVILRQLDALVNDADDHAPARLQRRM
jgi:hypothetical protein